MNRVVALFLSLFAMAGVLLLSACDGGDGSVEGTEPTAPALTPGQFLPTPSIADGVVDSTAYGYRARMPEGWTLRPSIVTSALGGGDAFFAPESDNVPGNEVHTNLSVICDRNPPAADLEEFVQQKVDIFQSLSREDVRVEDHAPVAGNEARLVTYRLERETYQIEKVQLLFLARDCGWTLALTTRVGELEKYRSLFEDFAQSFEVKAET